MGLGLGGKRCLPQTTGVGCFLPQFQSWEPGRQAALEITHPPWGGLAPLLACLPASNPILWLRNWQTQHAGGRSWVSPYQQLSYNGHPHSTCPPPFLWHTGSPAQFWAQRADILLYTPGVWGCNSNCSKQIPRGGSKKDDPSWLLALTFSPFWCSEG